HTRSKRDWSSDVCSSDLRAPTLLGVVQELRNAGAEVIQIGDVRVVASTAITTGEDGRLEVDGTGIDAPYVVRAIGDPAVMEPALQIPCGAADSVAGDGGSVATIADEDVRIEATVELSEPEHSRVVKWSSILRPTLPGSPRRAARACEDDVAETSAPIAQDPQQARKGFAMSGISEWNDENLDHTSKLSAI